MKKTKIILASPRGFCAGVKRAIEIVELAIKEHGAPIYVRHEIVHNKRVVEDLKKKGAIFVEELDEIPKGAKVIFSAHGVSRKVKEQANADTDIAAYGQLWVKSSTPNTLQFTDDAGTDQALASIGKSVALTIVFGAG